MAGRLSGPRQSAQAKAHPGREPHLGVLLRRRGREWATMEWPRCSGALRAPGEASPGAPAQFDREALMDYPECYELVFQAPAVEDDVVIVHRTERAGAGGYPVYEDESGIVRAEISDRGEVRMLASGGHQMLRTPMLARPLTP